VKTVKLRVADRQIAAYELGDLAEAKAGRLGGRIVLPKHLKTALVESSGSRCAICLNNYEARHLQMDHRIPYEVGGEQDPKNHTALMLLCGSCNRAKSWSCEHCPNWITEHDVKVCDQCYWASPQQYRHIALRQIRRLDVVWAEDDVEAYEKLVRLAKGVHVPLPDYVKAVLSRHANNRCSG
jgi:hypothetical protein